MARLFFALWPPAEARPALDALAADLAKRCGGRAVPAGKIHLTLAFLGEVDAGDGARARLVAGRIAGPALDLCFDRIGSFARTRVAWVGMSETARDAIEFVAQLSAGLRDAGFVLDQRPFVAHATLVRRVARPLPPASIAPIRWTARRFALVESDLRTGRYEEKEGWKLGGKTR